MYTWKESAEEEEEKRKVACVSFRSVWPQAVLLLLRSTPSKLIRLIPPPSRLHCSCHVSHSFHVASRLSYDGPRCIAATPRHAAGDQSPAADWDGARKDKNKDRDGQEVLQADRSVRQRREVSGKKCSIDPLPSTKDLLFTLAAHVCVWVCVLNIKTTHTHTLEGVTRGSDWTWRNKATGKQRHLYKGYEETDKQKTRWCFISQKMFCDQQTAKE